MADVILKDAMGNDQTYENIDNISLMNTEGAIETFISERLVQNQIQEAVDNIPIYIGTTIAFTINNIDGFGPDCIAEENMMWGNWVNSEYNVDQFWTADADCKIIHDYNNGQIVTVYNGDTIVNSSDVIITNAIYVGELIGDVEIEA